MGYDRGDNFLFDFEPNGNQFGSKSKGKRSPRSYPIQFERKWNTSFLSARAQQNGFCARAHMNYQVPKPNNLHELVHSNIRV